CRSVFGQQVFERACREVLHDRRILVELEDMQNHQPAFIWIFGYEVIDCLEGPEVVFAYRTPWPSLGHSNPGVRRFLTRMLHVVPHGRPSHRFASAAKLARWGRTTQKRWPVGASSTHQVWTCLTRLAPSVSSRRTSASISSASISRCT